MTRQSLSLILQLVLFSFSLTLSLRCKSQTDSSTASWKEATHNKVSFKYPNDWTFQKQTVPGSVLLTVTPNELAKLKSLKPFEIIEVEPQGRTYSDFKRDFVQAVSARAQNEIKITNKRDTTFQNLKTTKADAIFYYKSNPIPATLYAIDGGNKFYMITIMSYKEKDEITAEMDVITGAILKSLVIRK